MKANEAKMLKHSRDKKKKMNAYSFLLKEKKKKLCVYTHIFTSREEVYAVFICLSQIFPVLSKCIQKTAKLGFSGSLCEATHSLILIALN